MAEAVQEIVLEPFDYSGPGLAPLPHTYNTRSSSHLSEEAQLNAAGIMAEYLIRYRETIDGPNSASLYLTEKILDMHDVEVPQVTEPTSLLPEEEALSSSLYSPTQQHINSNSHRFETAAGDLVALPSLIFSPRKSRFEKLKSKIRGMDIGETTRQAYVNHVPWFFQRVSREKVFQAKQMLGLVNGHVHRLFSVDGRQTNNVKRLSANRDGTNIGFPNAEAGVDRIKQDKIRRVMALGGLALATSAVALAVMDAGSSSNVLSHLGNASAHLHPLIHPHTLSTNVLKDASESAEKLPQARHLGAMALSHTVRLAKGETIMNEVLRYLPHIHKYLPHLNSHLSEHYALKITGKILHANHLTWPKARFLPVHFKFSIPSVDSLRLLLNK